MLKKILISILLVSNIFAASMSSEIEDFLYDNKANDVSSNKNILDLSLPEDFYNQDEVPHYRYMGDRLAPRKDKKYFLPMDIRGEDLLKIAAGAGFAIIAFKNDQAIRKFTENNKSDVLQVASDLGEKFGAGLYAAGTFGISYVVGVVMKNNNVKSYSLFALKTEILTGLVAQAIKMTFHRKRPSDTEDPYVFGGPDYTDTNDRSFPSGHTATAFTVATLIADASGDSKIIPILAYGAATVAGASRVYDNAHWASDVVIGALLGHIVTRIVLRGFKRRGKKGRGSGFLITPTFRKGDFGLQFKYLLH